MTRLLRADRRLGILLGGVIVLVSFSVGAAVVVPATDPAIASVEASRTLDDAAKAGMDVYRSEGCWYCHTMQVRDVTSDDNYGEVLGPEGYAHMRPAMAGDRRVGPDLTHVGSRLDREGMLRALRFPRRDERVSVMPSYDHLGSDELDNLVAFLLSLE